MLVTNKSEIMSSFSCPHLDFGKDYCIRLKKDCVPGRPGCVLGGNKYQFAVPAEKRIKKKEEHKKIEKENEKISKQKYLGKN
jgi:hypothetical protein